MPKKILLVDDEPDIRTLVVYRLERAGYRVEAAIDGPEALELIKKEPPDLILLDLCLPVTRGDDVCKKLKADDRLKSIPIILFTVSTENICEDFKKCGADDYLIKPFDSADLLEKVKKIIG
jgi:CheY-like chemotaxis protein